MIKDQRAGGKKNPPTKEEKTIRITKQTDFVQRDEFHGAEEPMPNVTFREIKRQKKAAQKAAEREQEEQLRKEAEEAEKVPPTGKKEVAGIIGKDRKAKA